MGSVANAASGAAELNSGAASSKPTDAASSVSNTTVPPPSSSPGPFLSPAETGARPKVSTSSTTIKDESTSQKKEVTAVSSEEIVKVEGEGEGQKENPFEALAEEKNKTAEQEEIRKRRLAVFEEQKRRLMNK